LIEAFKSVTGVSVLLNTSFNVMGQPIVETPRQAVECFLGVQMDFLVFNAKFVIDASLVPDEYKKLRT
jgi:carbamoyltransferase